MNRLLLLILIVVFIISGCKKESLFQNNVRHNFWLSHKGADLPIVVEGNTQSKVFLLLLHGGPGASAQEFNAFNQPFTDLLEDQYAVVYYDQRNAGLARGEWDESLFTVAQHIDDLDEVIKFIKFKFGDDIQLFLAGHSWGGYLGTAYLIQDNNQSQVISWINIDGAINRNNTYHDRLIRIPEIANEQIAQNNHSNTWNDILQEIEAEIQLGIEQYDITTEVNLNRIMGKCERLLAKSDIFTLNVGSTFQGVYANNYHPFIANANSNRNDSQLYNEMYNVYDELIENNLSALNIPTLSIYGYYDVRTPLQQGQYLLNGISTSVDDKKIIIIDKAGHSPMRSETTVLANSIIEWIETYR